MGDEEGMSWAAQWLPSLVTGKGAKPPLNKLATEAGGAFRFHASHFLAQLLCSGGCVSLRSLHALVLSGLGLSIHPFVPLRRCCQFLL